MLLCSIQWGGGRRSTTEGMPSNHPCGGVARARVGTARNVPASWAKRRQAPGRAGWMKANLPMASCSPEKAEAPCSVFSQNATPPPLGQKGGETKLTKGGGCCAGCLKRLPGQRGRPGFPLLPPPLPSRQENGRRALTGEEGGSGMDGWMPSLRGIRLGDRHEHAQWPPPRLSRLPRGHKNARSRRHRHTHKGRGMEESERTGGTLRGRLQGGEGIHPRLAGRGR